ncbi:hypothetical protein PVK06_020761 [Gossypium arboreum]|uniref:Aminotransferase-like plant mobile domain-containing protein n=1 Tax=Gossypium arboreum TaxID=29729 RepID=A0ABR0PNX1_GOSAR|nr:hypothetical protein PVK06_020761 [Gossypium arboreum]
MLATLYREMCGATPPNKAKIRGCLSLLQSWARFPFPFLRPRVSHSYTFPLIMRWNHSASYVEIPTALEDIRLLLYQRSEAHFQWTPCDDLAIRVVIPDGFFQNLNIWHVKVPLVNYATVEMHQTDRVLRQFGFRQPIPVTLEVLDNEHKINLRQSNLNWPVLFLKYIEIWKNQYDYIPIREPVIVLEIHGKPYFLSEEQRRLQIRVERELQGPLNLRRRVDSTGLSIAPTQSQGRTPQVTTPIPQPLQNMPGGSSSQHPQLEQPQPPPEQPQPLPEAESKRNPVRNRRPPPCSTDFDWHIH